MAPNRSFASLAYRRVASLHTSPVAKLLALYDTLCGDLQRAVEAMKRGEIEARCRELKHGFTVLTLDAMLDMKGEGQATAASLRRFYAHLRSEMLRAQFTMSPEVLEQACKHILQVRGAWVEVQAREANRSAAEQPAQVSGEPLSFEA